MVPLVLPVRMVMLAPLVLLDLLGLLVKEVNRDLLVLLDSRV